MQHTFEAIYENGLLRPLESLPLSERQRVVLSIEEEDDRVFGDEDLLDHELLNSLKGETLRHISLERVQAALSTIPGSMTQDFVEEREERF